MKTLRYAVASLALLGAMLAASAEASQTSRDARTVQPNPFTSYCTFTLTMPVDGRVKIIVYDILGREVCDVTAENQQWDYTAGVHHVKWSGKNASGNPVAAGTYICVLWSSDGEVINSVKVVKTGRLS